MLKIATGEVFEPKYQDGAAVGKPYRAKLHFLTPEERDMSVQIMSLYKSGEKDAGLSRIFLMGVESLENIAVEIDGKIVEVKTAADFLKYPMPHALYFEIVLRIIAGQGLTEDERKN